jgi:hypothetical protein
MTSGVRVPLGAGHFDPLPEQRASEAKAGTLGLSKIGGIAFITPNPCLASGAAGFLETGRD